MLFENLCVSLRAWLWYLICLIQIETKVYFDKLTKKHACYSYEISTQKKRKENLSLILTICALFGGKRKRFVLYYHYNIVFCLLAINQSINQFFCVFLTVRMFVLFPFLSFFFFDYCLTSAKQMLDE